MRITALLMDTRATKIIFTEGEDLIADLTGKDLYNRLADKGALNQAIQVKIAAEPEEEIPGDKTHLIRAEAVETIVATEENATGLLQQLVN